MTKASESPTDNADEEVDISQSSRRNLIGRGAIAAAAGLAAGAIASDRASAADGDNMKLGSSNTASSTTELSGGSSLSALDGDSTVASILGLSSQVDGVGVSGQATGENGTGVFGYAEERLGAGVLGHFDGNFNEERIGSGVVASSTFGWGIIAEGNIADLVAGGSGRIDMSASETPITPTGFGFPGTLARDESGTLWWCHADSKWRVLSGIASSGAFHAISPIRAFDSRKNQPSPGKVRTGQSRKVLVADSRSQETGAILKRDVVPVGSTAVSFNITATSTENRGFLSVLPGDAATFETSTINWPSPNFVVANGSTVTLDSSRSIRVFCGGAASAADFIIDITGYYL